MCCSRIAFGIWEPGLPEMLVSVLPCVGRSLLVLLVLWAFRGGSMLLFFISVFSVFLGSGRAGLGAGLYHHLFPIVQHPPCSGVGD